MSKNQNETEDLAAKMPEKLSELPTKWEAWMESVHLPTKESKSNRQIRIGPQSTSMCPSFHRARSVLCVHGDSWHNSAPSCQPVGGNRVPA